MKKNNQLLILAVCLLSITVLTHSCIKKNIDFSDNADQLWSPEVAIPLVNTSFTIKDILVKADQNGNIQVGSDNFCTLVYRGTLFSVKASDIVTLPQQSYNISQTLNATDLSAINALAPGASYTAPTTNQPVLFNPGGSGIKLDQMILKSGLLKFTINSSVRQTLEITIDIPSAKKAGVPFQKLITVNPSTSGPVQSNQSFDLTGYDFDLTRGGSIGIFNTFDVSYIVKCIKTNNSSSSGESISIDQSFSQLAFSLVKGDIGQQTLSNTTDTVDVSIFRNTVPGGGDFRINYAKIKLDVSNSYGVPVRATNLQLYPYAANRIYTPSQVTLPSSYNSLDINAPTTIGSTAMTYPPQFGGPSSQSQSNADLNSIINQKPQNFIYKVQTLSNPNGTPPANNRNFLTDQSRFKVDFQLDMPLFGSAWDFIFRDTLDFDIGENTSDRMNYLLFRNYTKNGFPFDVNMNLDFVDSSYRVMCSLVDGAEYGNVISSAPVGADGRVISPVEKVTDYNFDKAKINKLKNVKYIIVRAKGATTSASATGGPDVKIYSDYKLDLKMGIRSEFNIPLNGN